MKSINGEPTFAQGSSPLKKALLVIKRPLNLSYITLFSSLKLRKSTEMKHVLAPALAILLLSGCASITNGKMQPVSVNAVNKAGEDVEDAKCSLLNDKGTWYVTTPGSVMIQKSYGDMTITCKKKGTNNGVASVKSGANGGVFGNIVAGGLIGYAVDASNGAGFDYPTNITVEMGKTTVIAPQKAASAEQPKAINN